MSVERTLESRSAARMRTRGPLRTAGLVLGVLLAIAPAAHASDLSIQGCQCLLVPGNTVQVTLDYANTTAETALLFVQLTLPNDKKLYLSPVGLVERPVSWLTVAANSNDPPVDVLNQLLTPASLPFGNWPLVPPFHYQVSASLVDVRTTGMPIVPSRLDLLRVRAVRGVAAADRVRARSTSSRTSTATRRGWCARTRRFRRGGVDRRIDRDLAQSIRRYRFVIDQPIVLQAFESLRPGRKAELQQLIDAGRVEVAGGFYVLTDLNLLSGESMVRQILYGQRYLEERWGRRARIAWNLDQFGHPHQMPQLASKGGMPFYAFTRGIPSLADARARRERVLLAIARRLDACSPTTSATATSSAAASATSRPTIRRSPRSFAASSRPRSRGNFLTGDGADVSEQVLEGYQLNVLLPDAIAHGTPRRLPGVEARLSTPSANSSRRSSQSGAALPTIGPIEFQTDGEPDDPRIFPGSYASRIGVKQTNQRLENLQTDTEKLAMLAWIEGASYPGRAAEDQARTSRATRRTITCPAPASTRSTRTPTRASTTSAIGPRSSTAR